MTWMNEAASKFATRIKGSDYVLDSRIPSSYVVNTVLGRIIMRLRGHAKFLRLTNAPFVARHVVVKNKNNLELGRSVTFYEYSYVDALASSPVKLSANVSLGRYTRIECTGSLENLGAGIEVGENVGLGANCFYGCAGGIKIGANTIVGNFVSFHSENHVIADLNTPIRQQGVTHSGISIGEDCWIGAKATILDGADLGRGSVLAAGAVLTAGTYEPYTVYGGVPARRLAERRGIPHAG